MGIPGIEQVKGMGSELEVTPVIIIGNNFLSVGYKHATILDVSVSDNSHYTFPVMFTSIELSRENL
jgi:hypothetical protein